MRKYWTDLNWLVYEILLFKVQGDQSDLEYLLELVDSKIMKSKTKMRRTISAESKIEDFSNG